MNKPRPSSGVSGAGDNKEGEMVSGSGGYSSFSGRSGKPECGECGDDGTSKTSSISRSGRWDKLACGERGAGVRYSKSSCEVYCGNDWNSCPNGGGAPNGADSSSSPTGMTVSVYDKSVSGSVGKGRWRELARGDGGGSGGVSTAIFIS